MLFAIIHFCRFSVTYRILSTSFQHAVEVQYHNGSILHELGFDSLLHSAVVLHDANAPLRQGLKLGCPVLERGYQLICLAMLYAIAALNRLMGGSEAEHQTLSFP